MTFQPPRPTRARVSRVLFAWVFLLLLTVLGEARAVPVITVLPAGNQGFDVYADGVLVAPVRLAVNGAITAATVLTTSNGLYLSGLQAKDPLAVTFATNDFVSIAIPPTNSPIWEPVVQFQITVKSFNTNRWLAMFPDGAAPFHFLACSVPNAQVWHQRGWLNATPVADPFPLLQDPHGGSPELSCLWNRNWSYLCPLGAHPIPMIGLWDPVGALYVGYDFQGARASDQSDRYIATAYCWAQGNLTNFFTLAYPYGGLKYGQQVYPQGGEVLASWFNLEIDPNLPSTEDPNERFQARLFANYSNVLARVPAMNDLGWLPGQLHLNDFSGPIGLNLYGVGSESNYYTPGTIIVNGWRGETEMPIDTAVRQGNTSALNLGRSQVESMLTNYAQIFSVGGDTCLYWQQPLSGQWLSTFGGTNVNSLHNSEAWFAARVLVELYRYDLAHGQAKASYLTAIDELFNWAKHEVWTRNEFVDVPSSPFAIGCTLNTSFLLDYYFTFKNDPVRSVNAAQALQLADRLVWRYLQFWSMDSDHFDGGLDGSFLLEPNSGRDWAGAACANEVCWTIDTLTQVYVHTGDPRLRYYLRGLLQRWEELYQPVYADNIAAYGSAAFTEGLGIFDGSGPSRGYRYNYGSMQTLPLDEPVGASVMRVIAGDNACIAFDRTNMVTDVTDYRTLSNGVCSFRIVSGLTQPFNVSFSYPFVNISGLTVQRVRSGVTNTLSGAQITRPTQSPSSLTLSQLQNGDMILIGNVPAGTPTNMFDTSLVYNETNVPVATNGPFTLLPFTGDYLLPQDWTDLNSYAGVVPGLHWNYGVPYQQQLHAASGTVSVNAPGASVILVAYSPAPLQALSEAPTVTLDDNSVVPLSGNPVQVWRGWPIIFNQMVLQDYLVLPAGRSLAQVNANGTLVIGVTAFSGSAGDWQPFQTNINTASTNFVSQEAQTLGMLGLQPGYSSLPTNRIALLPLNTPGAAANFAAASGLDNKWYALTEQEFVNSNVFNATRFPVAFYLGNENYVKTVNTTGDGKTAVTQYLAGGGALVVLPSGPFPFYYGYGPNDQSGASDPLLPTYGMPFKSFDTAPPGTYVQTYANQTILHSVPAQFAFPPGDPRLRAINGGSVNGANRYVPLLNVRDNLGNNYGDAAVFIAFGTGPAAGGKILYVWDTLLSGPQGQEIMTDLVSWMLNATVGPATQQFQSIQMQNANRVMFNFSAMANLDYVAEYNNDLTTTNWTMLKDFSRATTNRFLSFTNQAGGTVAQFYRLRVGP